MSETVRSLRSLQDYLARDFPGCLLMPTAPGGKAPRLPHKPKANGEEQYTLADAYDRDIPLCIYGCLILLASDLIVVDVDDEDLAKTLLNQVDFQNTACARTKKGSLSRELQTNIARANRLPLVRCKKGGLKGVGKWRG
jgi:hypothetical protein